MVLDAISNAARNVVILLKRDLSHSPIPVKSEKKQGDVDAVPAPNTDQNARGFNFDEPASTVEVYEIWKVFLEENDLELDEVFVVISADFKAEGYRNGNWANIEYRGFYNTELEASNEIKGYLR